MTQPPVKSLSDSQLALDVATCKERGCTEPVVGSSTTGEGHVCRRHNVSWLVQRLQQPRAFKIAGQAIDNPFSFGGGYKNGGLSDGAMDLIRPIMSFDYMGAAEFEFGAVPEAFGKLAKHQEELTAWSFPVTRANRGWAKEDAQECEAVVYALAPAAWREEVETRVRGWAVDPPRMQEPPNLGRALLPKEDWDRDVCGWFELDNGFLVFTDGDMWRKTAALFDVEAPGA